MTDERDNPQDLPELPPAPTRRNALVEIVYALAYGAFFGTIGWAIGRIGDQGGRRTAQTFLGALGLFSGLFIRAHVVLKEQKEERAQAADASAPVEKHPRELATVSVEAKPEEVKPPAEPSPQVEAKSVATERVAGAEQAASASV